MESQESVEITATCLANGRTVIQFNSDLISGRCCRNSQTITPIGSLIPTQMRGMHRVHTSMSDDVRRICTWRCSLYRRWPLGHIVFFAREKIRLGGFRFSRILESRLELADTWEILNGKESLATTNESRCTDVIIDYVSVRPLHRILSDHRGKVSADRNYCARPNESHVGESLPLALAT
uniref:Uncharacterized protein n=1 Tax=Vespula pensylvanica TaxID=30213 RepID=A0A834U7M2_VESPE|nr:hypothetical protein H0235_010576 [Vespula pensylvanica]